MALLETFSSFVVACSLGSFDPNDHGMSAQPYGEGCYLFAGEDLLFYDREMCTMYMAATVAGALSPHFPHMADLRSVDCVRSTPTG